MAPGAGARERHAARAKLGQRDLGQAVAARDGEKAWRGGCVLCVLREE